MAATRCKRGHDLTAPDAWYEFQGGRKRTCAECRKISEAKRSRRKNPMIPPPPQPLDDIVYTPDVELCVQRPDAWTAQDAYTQERAAATCLLCPLLDACRAAAATPLAEAVEAISAALQPQTGPVQDDVVLMGIEV